MGHGAGSREENEAIVRAYCDAWSKGDLQTIVGLYHDEIVLHWFGRGPLAGEHRGKTAALSALAKLGQATNRTLLGIHDALASDAHAVILAHERFERDGRIVESRRVLLYHVRDGKLAEVWVYDEDQQALDELLGTTSR